MKLFNPLKQLKFYNPFKAHIAQRSNGNFVVRASALFYWSYLGRELEHIYWWSSKDHVERYCEVSTISEARHLLDAHIKSKQHSSKFIE